MRRTLSPLLWLALAIMLAGCTPFNGGDQPSYGAQPLTLSTSQPLGQSFTPRYDGIDGVSLYLEPAEPGDASSTLRFAIPGSDPARAILPLSQVTTSRWYRFDFPTFPEPAGYFQLSIEGPGSVRVGASPGPSYLEGSAYQSGEPVDAQLAFRLHYDQGPAAFGLALEALTWLLWLGAAAVVFVLPGWALLSLAWRAWPRLLWLEKLGLASGASAALYPLLLLWTDLAGLHLGLLNAWLLPALAVLALAARWWRVRGRRSPLEPAATPPAPAGYGWAERIPAFAAAFALALVFATRLFAVRGLAAPLWGDAYQHTLITQLIADHGGLFRSWQPYAALTTFTYHFGFHALAAVFHWVTGVEVTQSVILSGQILNGLAVAALAPLASLASAGFDPETAHTRRRWALLIALLAAGLLSPVPGSYANWGRYTQLAGQTILPAAVVLLAWLALRPRSQQRLALPEALAAGVLMGGLAVAHYRVLLFAILALVILAVFALARRSARVPALHVLIAGAVGGALFLPWFANVFGGQILAMFGQQLATPAAALSEAAQTYNDPGALTLYQPVWMWRLLAAGALSAVLLAVFRRTSGPLIAALWWGLVALAANPRWLGLPGEGVISNFAALIAVYIPTAVLAGAALGWLAEQVLTRLPATIAPAARIALAALLALAVLAGGAVGARSRVREIQPMNYAMVTGPDVRAAGWIARNTRESAVFYINAFPAYSGAYYVGADAGWWLPLLAGRGASIPPLTYSMEAGPRPDYMTWVNALPAAVDSLGITSPGAQPILDERGITHVYIGQRGGMVGRPGDVPPPLDPAALQASPYFRMVYHEDRVWVFERLPAAAAAIRRVQP